MKRKIAENKYNILFLIECLLFLILSYFFVPNSDDLFYEFNFKYNSFKELFHQILYYGNGRFIGNMTANFFSNHIQLFYLLETIIISCFAILTEKLTELKNSKILIFALVTIIPVWQFKELISWMCAFINYFIPVVILVAVLLIIKKHLCKKHKIFFAVIFILGFCEQLFAEHNTIVNIIICVFLLIIFNKKHFSAIKETVVLLISNILGAAVMFGYKYFIDYSKTYMAVNTPVYRKTILTWIEESGIKGGIRFMLQEGKYFIIVLSCSALLIAVLFAVMILVEKKSSTKNIKHTAVFYVTGLSYIILFILAEYNIYVFNNDIPDNKHLFSLALLLFIVLTFILLSVLLYKIIIKRMTAEYKLKVLSAIGFAAISFAPFLLVYPYMYRCAFLSVFFLILALIYIIKFAYEKYDLKIERIYDTVFAAAIIVMIIYISLYANEKKIYNYKREYFETSQYLPASSDILIHWTNEKFWDFHSNIQHEFVPLEEFERIIAEKNMR